MCTKFHSNRMKTVGMVPLFSLGKVFSKNVVAIATPYPTNWREKKSLVLLHFRVRYQSSFEIQEKCVQKWFHPFKEFAIHCSYYIATPLSPPKKKTLAHVSTLQARVIICTKKWAITWNSEEFPSTRFRNGTSANETDPLFGSWQESMENSHQGNELSNPTEWDFSTQMAFKRWWWWLGTWCAFQIWAGSKWSV